MLSRRRLLQCAAAAALLPEEIAMPEETADAARRPNLLIILTDDQGRGDYSAFGTPDIRTPGIDRLCREGITLRNFYSSSPVCSPARAALLTGCHSDRVGVPGVIRHTPDNSWGWLAPSATLLPRALETAGYRSALVGKWHLGLESPNTPTERGFAFFHGFLGDMMDDYWTHRRDGHNFMRRNRQVIDPEGHATDLFTDWACAWLHEQEGRRHPWFLYLAYNAPHDPIQPPPDWLARVRAREPGMDEPRARLVALIEHMDAGVARVLETLDRTGQAGDTLVVFTSDNGGVLRNGANNGPWRSEKEHVYEGGLRVPFCARWPGRIAAGSQGERVSVMHDLFPTLLEAAGAHGPAGIDGVSFLPALLGRPQPEAERDLYFVRREGGAPYGAKTIEALRRGDWKLIQDSPYAPLELYNLADDPRETTNLVRERPEVVRDLHAALRRQIQRGGQVPWQKPEPAQP